MPINTPLLKPGLIMCSQQCGETRGGGGGYSHANDTDDTDDDDDDDEGSSSEQSSSTSASNQKENNKYCDCCYCEFFGHGQVGRPQHYCFDIEIY